MEYDIGFLDSGIGGLHVMKEARRLLPNASFVYLADNKNAPYGNKSREDILLSTHIAAKMLVNHGIKTLVLACNTATAVAAESLREMLDIPVVGIEPAIKPAINNHKEGKVLVIATNATLKYNKLLNSEEYKKRFVIHKYFKDLPFIIDSNPFAKKGEILQAELCGVKDIESVVIGCTHYAKLEEEICEILGYQPKFYFGAKAVAERVKCLTPNLSGRDETKFIFTGKIRPDFKTYYDSL